MHLSFPPKLEAFINHQVEAGLYNSKSDVVFDAVRNLYAEEQKLIRLKKAIAAGEEGRGIVVDDLDAFLDTLMKEAKENSRKGKKIDPDVIP